MRNIFFQRLWQGAFGSIGSTSYNFGVQAIRETTFRETIVFFSPECKDSLLFRFNVMCNRTCRRNSILFHLLCNTRNFSNSDNSRDNPVGFLHNEIHFVYSLLFPFHLCHTPETESPDISNPFEILYMRSYPSPLTLFRLHHVKQGHLPGIF